ncbi:hypothetical protein VTI74DRAFT_3304 [Chaetomium olivicolor]
METINNLATAASKAIWGERQSHEEPVSGKMGNTAAGEPYDAGNIEPNEAALSSTGQEGIENRATPTKDTEDRDTETRDALTNAPKEPALPTISRSIPLSTTAAAGTESQSFSPKPSTETAVNKPSTEEKLEQQPRNSAGPAAAAPSAVSMRDDSTKAQNDTRPPPSPSSTEQEPKPHDTSTTTGASPTTVPGTKETIPGSSTATTGTATKDEATSTPSIGTSSTAAGAGTEPGPEEGKKEKKKDDTPQKPDDDGESPDIKLEGPGPRPLEEVAREHGGDAGAAKATAAADGGSGSEAETGAGAGAPSAGGQRRDSGKSVGGGESEGGAMKRRSGGTGEEYVKSTGLQADGGDFDASRPGAGREADRLLEEKGVNRGSAEHHGHRESGHHEAGHEGKEKVKLKDKIKAKLHKGSTSA